MAIILAIDPGTRTSGVVLYDSDARRITYANSKTPNADLLDEIRGTRYRLENFGTFQAVAIERVQAQGSRAFKRKDGSMGARGMNPETMLTVEWASFFHEAAARRGLQTGWWYRNEVLRHHDVRGSKSEADKLIRSRCLERFGGDRKTAQGTKKAPGPLYGVAGHSWQALGLALLVADL